MNYVQITKKPSRVLNEKPGFLGLSVIDFAVLGYFLIFSHTILSTASLELLAFPLSGVLTILLIGIRLKHRPKAIRDFLLKILTKRIL